MAQLRTFPGGPFEFGQVSGDGFLRVKQPTSDQNACDSGGNRLGHRLRQMHGALGHVVEVALITYLAMMDYGDPICVIVGQPIGNAGFLATMI